MKHLIIRNFGPIEEVDIDIKRVNLIIGPQSSGKSCVLKIACYCDWVERQIEITQDPDRFCNPSSFVGNLIGFHKLDGYMKPDSYIMYENDAVSFEYSEKTKKCNFKWKKASRWNYKRVKIAYIPSERNLVAAIPNWFQVSMKKDNILDFMQEWEFARKSFSKGEKILDLPVVYKYNPMNQADSIELADGKELDLTVTSSGLQSLTPLYIMLRYLTTEFYKEEHTTVEQMMFRENLAKTVGEERSDLPLENQLEIVERILKPHHTDLFIEEPEAHIFPSTQKSFVYSLVKMLNGSVKHTCFLATHSPYVMTSFNNLIFAGEVAAVSKENEALVKVRFPKRSMLKYKEVAAFEMRNGRAYSIMDDECHLISAEAIDSASQEIGGDFDYLLNL